MSSEREARDAWLLQVIAVDVNDSRFADLAANQTEADGAGLVGEQASPQAPDVGAAPMKHVTLEIFNSTEVPLHRKGTRWSSSDGEHSDRELPDDIAPGRTVTGTVHFATADKDGQPISQEFTVGYLGTDRSAHPALFKLGFSFADGKLEPAYQAAPSPPFSCETHGDDEHIVFELLYGAQPTPKKLDLSQCKLVHNQVDGPKNHLLCSKHGHVVDTDASSVIADSIDEYHKIYYIGRPITDCQPDPGKLPHAPNNIVVCKKHGEVYDSDKGVVLANTRTMYLRAHPEHAGPAGKTASKTPGKTAANKGEQSRLDLEATLAAAKKLRSDVQAVQGASWGDCRVCLTEAGRMVAAARRHESDIVKLIAALEAAMLSLGTGVESSIPAACIEAMNTVLNDNSFASAEVAHQACIDSKLQVTVGDSDSRARILATQAAASQSWQNIGFDRAELQIAWKWVEKSTSAH